MSPDCGRSGVRSLGHRATLCTASAPLKETGTAPQRLAAPTARECSYGDRRSPIPDGFEVGAPIGPKLGGFALHLPNQLTLFVSYPSCPFKVVAEPTNTLEPLGELGALVDSLLLVHEGSIALHSWIVTRHNRTSWSGTGRTRTTTINAETAEHAEHGLHRGFREFCVYRRDTAPRRDISATVVAPANRAAYHRSARPAVPRAQRASAPPPQAARGTV
jgi:hypothetical protein